MTSETQAVVDFYRLLANTRRHFRKSHISSESSWSFADVSGTTSHGEKELIDGDSRNSAVEVSFSLDSELREVLSVWRYSLGVSVASSRGTRTPSRGGTTGNQGSTGLRFSGSDECLVPFVGWSL